MDKKWKAPSKQNLRVRLSGHAKLKHNHQVNIDVAPVFLRSALKQHCFIQWRILSVSQFLKIRSCCKRHLLSESADTDAVMFVIVARQRKLGFCCLLWVKSPVYAYQYLWRLISEYSGLHSFVLFVCADALLTNQQFLVMLGRFPVF